ncbi:amidase [Pseudomonas abietaniphila]|uniref:amidase n=1 Tax=Pseudomonas abietaniphila TaxID=89065 RepID=UPI000A823E45|nr:amidase family protein [Pseudomonas abietaniphila]
MKTLHVTNAFSLTRRTSGSLCAIACLGLAANTQAVKASPAPSVYEASISELQAAMSAGTISSHELVEQYLARINAYDQQGPALNAMVSLNPNALLDAERLDEERRTKGPRGPLHGIPIVVKDNYDTADMPTSGGTLALANLRPTADAYQVQRLRAAGAVIIGKTTMHELAAGVTTVSSLTGYTRNAYDPTRAPGGSSGGTAVAVAASFAAAGMGSDTCGSIRIPAAYQNLVGLRTTRGLASRSGVMPLSSTQDVAGPMARTVSDLAVMLDATVGSDASDPSTADANRHIPPSYLKALKADSLKGARIGVIRGLFGNAPEDMEVAQVIDKALDQLKTEGATVVEISIPELDELLRDSSIIPYEFKYDLAAYLAKHPGAPVNSLSQILAQGMDHLLLDPGLRVRDAVDLEKASDQEALKKVLQKREALKLLITRHLHDQHLNALAYPTIQRKPALIGEPQFGATNCQLSASTGLPAIALPAGWTTDQLPVGLELLGNEFSESELLNLAYGWERSTQPRHPPFTTPPLEAGKAPALMKFQATPLTTRIASVEVNFDYDRLTGKLAYTAHARNIPRDQVIGVTLARSLDERPGPIIWNLLKPHMTYASDSLILKARDREELLAGRLRVQLYTLDSPLGVGAMAVRELQISQK